MERQTHYSHRKEWTRVKPAKHKSRWVRGQREAVYRFKITLQNTDPAIWRRIETKDLTLEDCMS